MTKCAAESWRFYFRSDEGAGLSLRDIFEEEVEVDEALRDLAESMEDVPAQEIADDLRAFFEELEASMQ